MLMIDRISPTQRPDRRPAGRQQRRELLRGQVHHSPYQARLLEFEEGLVAAAGLRAVQGPPPLVRCAPGVDVEVFALEAV